MQKKKAIIIGSSMAGLLAARVCANHFEEVLVLEKDKIQPHKAHRKGVPQDQQLHILLSRGLETISRLFPGIQEELEAQGAIAGDIGQLLQWYSEGDFRPQCQTGEHTIMMSRPLLELTIRKTLLQRSNVHLQDQTRVIALLGSQELITGVETKAGYLTADLVIDATGVGSRMLSQLSTMGVQLPPVEEVKVNVKYTSFLFPREESFKSLININSKPPFNSKHGTIQPIEGGKMIAMVQGRSNDIAPTSIDTFKQYTSALEHPLIYEKIKDLVPLSEGASYHIPFVRWVHFEQLKQFPQGILPLGDAVCRLNPVYGQGMSSAAMQAEILEELLQQRKLQLLWKPYFKQVAKAVKTPWELTVAEDFKFPETEGVPPKIPALLIRYFTKLNRVMNNDPDLFKAFAKVLNMVSNPTILLHPKMIWKVLWAK